VSDPAPSLGDQFEDVLAANRAFAAEFDSGGIEGTAAKGLAVLTCMDCRVDPLRMLGLRLGDAKILRNAGARVTDEVLKAMALAVALLRVHRIMVVAHTGCAMAGGAEERLHEKVAAAGGPDTRSLALLTTDDQVAALRADVQRLESWPYLAGRASVGGFRYDVDTGLVTQVC
jgi:carbonic anhydrase